MITAALVKELRETWVELKQDKSMKATIKFIVYLFAFILLINVIVFTIKTIQSKPTHAFGISNGIEPDTINVIKYVDNIVYIHDTIPTAGRDINNVKGSQTVNNNK